MQRRNFISNMAVLVPAGLAAPKLLFDEPGYSGPLTAKDFIVLGAGDAGLFIAHELNKGGKDVLVLEAGSESPVYNHAASAARFLDKGAGQQAGSEQITSRHYNADELSVQYSFQTNKIIKTGDGFIVTNGKENFITRKLVVAVPVNMDLEKASLEVQTTEDSTATVCCKRKIQRNPAQVITMPAKRISANEITKFSKAKQQSLLAVL